MAKMNVAYLADDSDLTVAIGLVASKQHTKEELTKWLSERTAHFANLAAEAEKLKSAAAGVNRSLGVKIGPAGTVNLTGVNGRFGLSIYLADYDKIDGGWDTVIRPFVKAHRAEFSQGKDDKRFEQSKAAAAAKYAAAKAGGL